MAAAGAVLVAQLRARGFRLRLEGETLFVAPGSRLTADEREYLRRHKTAVLAALTEEVTDPAVALALKIFNPGLLRCPRCGGDHWRPDSNGHGERCATCDAWSPCSLQIDAPRTCAREPTVSRRP